MDDINLHNNKFHVAEEPVLYLKSLTGIRGFAVLLVLLSHATYCGLNLHPSIRFLGGGRYGVFLFFVLSSFLLTRQFIEADFKKKDKIKFIKYYFIRRILRIYPLYIISMIIYYIIYKSGYRIITINFVIFIKSILLLDAEGIYWTIPVEFQYYLILPFIAFLFLKLRLKTIIVFYVIYIFTWGKLFPPEFVTNVIPFLPIFISGSVCAFIFSALSRYIHRKKDSNLRDWIFNTLSFIILLPNYYNIIFSANIGREHFHKEFILFSILGSCFILFTPFSTGIIKRFMESKFMVI